MAEKFEKWIGQFYVKIFNFSPLPDTVHTILQAYTNKDLEDVRKEFLKHDFSEIKNATKIMRTLPNKKNALLSADFADCRKGRSAEDYPKNLPMKLTVTLEHKDIKVKGGELDEKTNKELILEMKTRFEKKINNVLKNAPDAQD